MAKEEVKKNDESEVLEKDQATQEVKEIPKTVAKAGKRSAKAIAEAEMKHEKEEKKAVKEASLAPKKSVKPTRSILERRGKNYKKVAVLVDKTKNYNLEDAVKLAIDTSTTKFDSTVELHINLNVDPRHADQNIRDSIILPSGTGNAVRVAVFAEDKQAADAKKAGADIVGSDDFLKLLDKEQLDFDVLISTPALMAKLGKYARLLGPKGLMPNPKSGTVTPDVAKAVSQAKAGKVEYRVDSTGIVHMGIGKVSFGADKVKANFDAVLANIKSNKPNSIKGSYIKAVHLTTSMGPSITVDLSSL
jgi:large subunit ribosomal protein L1